MSRCRPPRPTQGEAFILMTRCPGHGQTAARLQRDWGQPNPEALPFATSVKPHALIRLLHKGLRLHEFETSIDQVCSLRS